MVRELAWQRDEGAPTTLERIPRRHVEAIITHVLETKAPGEVLRV